MKPITPEQFQQFIDDNSEVLNLAKEAGVSIDKLPEGAIKLDAFDPSWGETVSAGLQGAVGAFEKQGLGLGRAATEKLLETSDEKTLGDTGIAAPVKIGDVVKELGLQGAVKKLSTELATEDANVSRKISDSAPFISDPDSAKATAYQAIQGVLPSVTTGLGLMALTRSPAAAGAGIGTGAFGSYYGESRDKGLTPEQSRERAGEFAALEMASESIPFAAALGKLGGGALARIAKSTVAEGAQEGATTIIQALRDKVALGEEIPDDLLQQAWRDFKAGALGGGVLGAGGAVINRGEPNIPEQSDEQKGKINPDEVNLNEPTPITTEPAPAGDAMANIAEVTKDLPTASEPVDLIAEPETEPQIEVVEELPTEETVPAQTQPVEELPVDEQVEEPLPVEDVAVEPSDEIVDVETAPEEPAVIETEVSEPDAKDTGKGVSGKEHTVYTPDNKPIKTKAKIMEADDLVASHDIQGVENPEYPQELQQRDRSKPALVAKVKKISQEINPARLDLSADIASGAPVVNDTVVESGNGRTIAIKEAYRSGKADAYKKHLIENADKYGIKPEDIKNMKQPVLVLQREGDLSGKELQDFTKEANQDLGVKMSPVERAKSDAELLSDDDLLEINLGQAGDMNAASNQKFLGRFAQRLGENEAAGYITDDKQWNTEMGQRALAAVFQKAYGDKNLTSNVFEEANQDTKRVMSALARAAGQVAKLKGYKDGDLGLGKAIADAANMVRSAQKKGQSIEEYINQIDMLDKPSPVAMDIAELFGANITSTKRMGDVLVSLAKQIESEHQGSSSGDLFNGQGLPPLNDVIKANEDYKHATTKQEKPKQTGDLFGANPPKLPSETKTSSGPSKQRKGRGTKTEDAKRVATVKTDVKESSVIEKPKPSLDVATEQPQDHVLKAVKKRILSMKGLPQAKNAILNDVKDIQGMMFNGISFKDAMEYQKKKDLESFNVISEVYEKVTGKDVFEKLDTSKVEEKDFDDIKNIGDAVTSIKDAKSFARWISNNAKNEFNREIATRLESILNSNIEIKPISYGKAEPVPSFMHNAKGMYRKSDGKESIYLKYDTSKAADADENTVVHEMIHAALYDLVEQGNLAKNKDTRLGKAVSSLYSLQKEVADAINKSYKEGKQDQLLNTLEKKIASSQMGNIHELITWGLTSNSGQQLLKDIKVTPKETAWSKFTRTVARILGVKPKDYNALRRLLEVTDELMEIGESGDTGIKASLKQMSIPTGSLTDLAANKVREKFAPPEKPEGLKAKLQELKDLRAEYSGKVMQTIRKGVADKYNYLKIMDKNIYGDDFMHNITSSSWALAKMANAADGALTAMLEYGRIRYNADQKVIEVIDDKSTGGLKGVLSQLNEPNELSDFFMWVASNRAHEINAAANRAELERNAVLAERKNLRSMLDIENLKRSERNRILKALKDSDTKLKELKKKSEVRERFLDPETIDNGMKLNTLKRKDGGTREKLFDKVLDDFNEYRGDVLRVAEATGVISSENRAMWEDQFYVPFYRVLEDKERGPQPAGGLSRQKATEKLKGSTKQLGDLMENSLMNFHHLLNASMKNMAARQAIENGETLGIAKETSEHKKSDDATYVLIDGKKQWYDITDPELLDAITAMGHQADPSWLKAIKDTGGSVKRTFTQLTTIRPSFILANIIRDSEQAVAFSKGGGNVAKGLAAWGINHMTKVQADMLATGGAFSFGHVTGDTAKDIKLSINGKMRDVKVLDSPTKIKSWLSKAVTMYSNVQEAAENANRTAVYLSNQQELGKLGAALEARDLMDFSAGGAWGAVRFLTSVVPFMNARIQGLDKLARQTGTLGEFAKRGGKAFAKKQAIRMAIVMSGYAAASLALAWHNHDDEDYQELPDFVRDNYWFVKVGDHAILIPKPFELGVVANVMEQLVDKATGYAKDDAMKDYLWRTAMNTFNMDPRPQIIKPLWDLYSNKDPFTGSPIETVTDERYSPSMRWNKNSSEIAKATSKGLEYVLGDSALSPKQIDYLIKGYFSWVGTVAADTVSMATNFLSDVEQPTKHWYESSEVARFYKNMSDPRFTKSQQRFYDTFNKYSQVANDVKQLKMLGDEDEAGNLIRTQGWKIQLQRVMQRQNRALSELGKQEKLIRANKSLSGDDKRQALDDIQRRRTQISQGIMKIADDVKAKYEDK